MAETHVPDQAVLRHQFDDLEQQRESINLGMWLFLATEAMMFGGLFFTYALYRGAYPDAFRIGSQHLNVGLGTINTFALLLSSLTMALAVHAAAVAHTRRLILFLAATALLGGVFLGTKAVEWTHDYQVGLIPGLRWTYYDTHPGEAGRLALVHLAPYHVQMFFVVFFSMTGLHALHMIVGLGLLGVFIWSASRGRFAGGNDQPVEIVGLYWHFVDIIWVFLFPLLYLIAGFRPFAAGGH